MGDIGHLLNTFNLGPTNTVLLVCLFWIIKKKLCQHEAMYEWYVGQRAIERKKPYVESQGD